MKNLLSFVYGTLKPLNYKVFDKKPISGTPYPFIQFGINQPARFISPNIYTLAVDVWDRSDSTFRVETVADEVDQLLENLSYSDEQIQVKVKRQSRNALEDTDKEIKRRELVYELRVFKIC